MTKFVFGVAMSMLVLTCFLGCPTPGPVSPPHDADATAPADAALLADLDAALDAADASPDLSASPCAKACKTLATLGCPEALTPDGGKTCLALCTDSEASGLSLKPLCVGNAKDVAAVRACATVRCKK